MRLQIDLLPSASHWQTLAKVALAGDLADLQHTIVIDAVQGEGASAGVDDSRMACALAAVAEPSTKPTTASSPTSSGQRRRGRMMVKRGPAPR